ncbi:hypothetical protein SAMN05216267_104675 [Actinacidiphila rubida]|uniref:Uncharacterized protein n=1 Tax=Actinacidiphila rubida TaxID=310780 RepID=A0A1H8SZL4_9ACTN|nr:hypothetical protein SAMN05216267_104675 [Actinacidiphila rubida]
MKRTHLHEPPDTPARNLSDAPCPENCGRPIHTGPCGGGH